MRLIGVERGREGGLYVCLYVCLPYLVLLRPQQVRLRALLLLLLERDFPGLDRLDELDHLAASDTTNERTNQPTNERTN